VQDVKIEGIPLENAQAAIRMVKAKPRRILSPENRALRRSLMARVNSVRRSSSKQASLSAESIAEGREGANQS
jgi:hypothetical protein